MSKITLKIGDILCASERNINYPAFKITGFEEDKVRTANGGNWKLPLLADEWYVNGVQYAKEDIIMPELEPITKDNIVEVLKYNQSLGLEIKDIRIARTYILYNRLYHDIWVIKGWALNSNNWLAHIELDLGKLQPLPKKTNPFDEVKIGQWVKRKTPSAFITANKWYQRVEKPLSKKSDDNVWFNCSGPTVGLIPKPDDWDLSDIRDYNPDAEIVLKVGDIVKYHSGKYIIDKIDYANEKIFYCDGLLDSFGSFNRGNNEVESVNGREGKYVIPPFDFKQTLIDAGFRNVPNSGIYSLRHIPVAIGNEVWMLGEMIKPTPKNANIIIQMAGLVAQLERDNL